ncbi:MAG: hypothetical protein JXB46_04680 [Candidatus Eisenbacteria bacterium]|nr:hypothetical protein [Candidatus Eisenbacteria bacterium]
MTKRTVCVAVLGLLAALPAVAAGQQAYGDGFAIGGALLPNGSPQLLGFTRIGENTGIELGLGFDIQDDDRGSEFKLEAGISVKLYMSDREQFQPFVGGRFGVKHYSWEADHRDGEDTRFGTTAILGGEYFVTRKLSLEGGLELSMYFGSIELATGTRLAAFFYL